MCYQLFNTLLNLNTKLVLFFVWAALFIINIENKSSPCKSLLLWKFPIAWYGNWCDPFDTYGNYWSFRKRWISCCSLWNDTYTAYFIKEKYDAKFCLEMPTHICNCWCMSNNVDLFSHDLMVCCWSAIFERRRINACPPHSRREQVR